MVSFSAISQRLAGYVAACVAASGITLLIVRRRASLRRHRKTCDPPLCFTTCESHKLYSLEGIRYKLSISLPLAYHDNPASRESVSYPVIYVLDSEPYLFPLIAAGARINHCLERPKWYPDLIVVGIVEDLEDQCCNDGAGPAVDVRKLWVSLRPSRARDYLPTAAESPWGRPGAESLLEISGHASTFCRFMDSVVVPFIDGYYRTEKSQRALIGKSFGGSGVAHAMLEKSSASMFSHFILGSPSLAWDEKAFFRLEEESSASRSPLSAKVFYCYGGKENVQVANSKEFKRVLDSRGYPDLEITTDCVQGEDHGSVSFPFANRSLRWLADSLAKSRK